MHEKVECTQCHVKPVFTDVGRNCQDCHADVHQRRMGTNCAQCHTVQGWNVAVQQVKDHQNRFPLLGAHAALQCEDCHKRAAVGQFQGLSTACISCHQTDFQKTSNPNHVTSKFPQNCEMCHTFDSWLGATFNHAGPPANFALAGAHATVACTSCHIGGVFTNFKGRVSSPTDCGNSLCHLSTWQQTNNPKHSTSPAVFPIANCATCHNTTAWTTAIFDHSTTGFPLTNSHQMAPAGKANACTDCHVNNNYNFTSANTDCYGCHQAAWNSTPTFGGSVPNHITAGFPTSLCSQCHDTNVWTDSTFNHANTGFPLTNAHQIAPAGKVTGCDQCHLGNYSTLAIQPTDCGNSGCHLTTWQQTNNPTHATGGTAFAAANCSTCHNTITWTTAIFDHSTTGWPLTGSHQMAPAGKANACTDCHVNNNYNFTSANTDCYGCHQAAWNSTPTFGGSVPNHITAGFPTSLCSQCHDTIVWTDSTFNHASTGFPLTNSHQIAPAGKVTGCDQCHLGNYSSLAIQPTDCGNSQCHLTTWRQTNNPTHSTAGAPFAVANCSTCHNPTLWTSVVFDHSVTGWPLTGSHQLAPAGKVVACTDCHTGNNYNLTAANTDCYGCHQTAWQSTTTVGGNVPNHVTAGFSTSMCSTCHDTVLWTNGKFDHSATGFPLQGPHMLPPRTAVTGAVGPMVNACTDCHIGGNYTAGFPTTDCYGCHQSYFTNAQTYGASVPNHITANYPTTCATCHTPWVTQAWLGAVFNHTWFKLPHGKVSSNQCVDCHINANNYTKFSCENCHTVPTAHQPGMSHPSVCSPSPACWYNPPTRCYDCHKG